MLSDLEREKSLKYLGETRDSLLRTVEAFPLEHFSLHPGEGRWSAAQTLEHIVMVEGRALGRVRMALTEAADPARRSAMAGNDEALWEGVRSRTTRVEAPPMLQPLGDKSRAELVQAFQTAREATIAFAVGTEADLRSHCAGHPLFGDLDCYQWLMLIPSHGERHRAQIEEIQREVTGAPPMITN